MDPMDTTLPPSSSSSTSEMPPLPSNPLQGDGQDILSMADDEAVDPQNAHKFGVIISVPTIYINADENVSEDRTVPNMRVIPYNKLLELVQMCKDLIHLDNEAHCRLCDTLTRQLIAKAPESQQFMEMLNFSTELAQDIYIEENHEDIALVGLSFDPIREYKVNPNTGVLVSAEPITIEGGIQLYSQLDTADKITINKIRERTNDTDFNRMQLCLVYFEKFLMFTPGHVFNRSMKQINLTLIYLRILFESRPIQNCCHNDLKSNMLAYILDVVVRSRLMQAWQRDYSTKVLLNDIKHNYDNRLTVIKMIQHKTARDRCLAFMQLLKQMPELAHIADWAFFDKYMELLKKYQLTIDNGEFYLLGSNFLMEIATIVPSDLNLVRQVYMAQK